MTGTTTGRSTGGGSPWLGEAALQLPFDQYQRYSGAARAVAGLMGDAPYSMLEVGGAPGFPELFFTPERLAVVDRFGHHEGNFLVVDGARLPFDDESFDVVVTLDTLEHVVAEDREEFLRECRRVSRDLVVLSAPHATDHVREAELALQAFVTARFGEVFQTLQEHSDRGLPVAAETVATLSEDGWSCASAPSGYLPRWLAGMLVHHELLAVGMPELPELHAFYNTLMGPYDNMEPGYRRLVVASRHRPAAEVDELVASLVTEAPPGRADAVVAAVAGRLLSERVGLGQAEQVRKARSFDGLQQQLDHRTTELATLQARLDAAQAEVARRDHDLRELSDRLALAEGERRLLQARLAPPRLVTRARSVMSRVLQKSRGNAS